MAHPSRTADPARTFFLVALGAVVGLMVLFALAAGGGTADGGYTGGYTEGGSGSGGSTQFYDGGSITTTEDGGLIYSDDNGNSLSTG
jgi:hypothetical protein